MPLGMRVGALIPADPGRAVLDQMQGQWALPRVTKYKGADETVNNSSALQADDDLVFAVGAQETWVVEYFIIYSSATTADMLFDIQTPTGTSGFGSVLGRDTGGTESVFISLNQDESWILGGNGAASTLAHIKITLIIGNTPGNVTFRWAQNAAEVSNTNVKTGSNLIAQRVK